MGSVMLEEVQEILAEGVEEGGRHLGEEVVSQLVVPRLVGPRERSPVEGEASEDGCCLGVLCREGQAVVDGSYVECPILWVLPDQPVLQVPVRIADEVVEDAHLLELDGELRLLLRRQHCVNPSLHPVVEHCRRLVVPVHEDLEQMRWMGVSIEEMAICDISPDSCPSSACEDSHAVARSRS